MASIRRNYVRRSDAKKPMPTAEQMRKDAVDEVVETLKRGGSVRTYLDGRIVLFNPDGGVRLHLHATIWNRVTGRIRLAETIRLKSFTTYTAR